MALLNCTRKPRLTCTQRAKQGRPFLQAVISGSTLPARPALFPGRGNTRHTSSTPAKSKPVLSMRPRPCCQQAYHQTQPAAQRQTHAQNVPAGCGCRPSRSRGTGSHAPARPPVASRRTQDSKVTSWRRLGMEGADKSTAQGGRGQLFWWRVGRLPVSSSNCVQVHPHASSSPPLPSTHNPPPLPGPGCPCQTCLKMGRYSGRFSNTGSSETATSLTACARGRGGMGVPVATVQLYAPRLLCTAWRRQGWQARAAGLYGLRRERECACCRPRTLPHLQELGLLRVARLDLQQHLLQQAKPGSRGARRRVKTMHALSSATRLRAAAAAGSSTGGLAVAAG